MAQASDVLPMAFRVRTGAWGNAWEHGLLSVQGLGLADLKNPLPRHAQEGNNGVDALLLLDLRVSSCESSASVLGWFKKSHSSSKGL